ncbi:MAG: anhydro-N-acetylmuramic acid kinase [Pseudomonadales bacterium]|nr:anhydro-N-acetylmuramic acid kinase [Pseudomonadales bacterium]
MGNSKLFIGLMSGTSVDGIDAALVDFSSNAPALIAHHETPFPVSIRERIIALCSPGENEIDRCGQLDIEIGKLFAEAAASLLAKAKINPNDIIAIGSHGQTIRHRPTLLSPFTLQIGDPNTIAQKTGITTVADFRRKDMVVGGQGAPLLPAFHQAVLKSTSTCIAIVNIGGVGNITLLNPRHKRTLGFDTGPGNTLMDAWIVQHHGKQYDENGFWAAEGTTNTELLEALISDPYFELVPPKSTGREYFNLVWLDSYLEKMNCEISPKDVQATLLRLTALSIVNAIHQYGSATEEILVCGGGVHNKILMQEISTIAESLISPTLKTLSTEDKGINPDHMESMGFAWLAMQTLERKPGNLPSVTGAEKEVVLGAVFYP